MKTYNPPYTISDNMLQLVSLISEKIGKIDSCGMLESKPHLRRNNRIRSINSSLKIEANSLSLTQTRDVIDGHSVIGDRKEILEVKNAYIAYEKIGDIDPYSIEDLKTIHGIMTAGIIDESGEFRKNLVPKLMDDLFAWMNNNKDCIHPLILSAVFHYEFVFIHPFSDGNGRMARLWHTALLSQWRNMFQYIPLESQIEKFQDEYYQAILSCNNKGNSDIFIEFILKRIDCVLDEVAQQLSRTNLETTEYVRKMLEVMEYDVPYTATAIMDCLGLKSKETFRKNYMNPALEQGYVVMTVPDKPTSRNQRYIKK